MTIQELEQFIATYGTDIYSFCVYLTGNRPGDRGYPWEMLPF